MVTFGDQRQNERVDEMRKHEEEELAKILSEKYGVEYVDLTSKSIDSDALKLVTEEGARAGELAVFRKIGKRIYVAMRSPERPDSLLHIQELEKNGWEVRRFMASSISLAHAWERYKDISYATTTEAGVLTVSNESIQSIMTNVHEVADIKKLIDEAVASTDTHHISRILEVIMGGALSLKASDVHIEPEADVVRMRFRLDGMLNEIHTFDAHTYKLIDSRIKLLSGLKINVESQAQDGRFSIVVHENEIEIRTSLIPGNYGESIVMRLLDPSTIGLDITQLGFDTYLLDILKREIAKPNGMILNTGPTGSGKTTTLYAFLKYSHEPGIKIITIEDPIEYHLAGIVQTQVEKEYTFASGLRAALRQDPDIIMVGEIRDHEVAETAVQAALTGHIVFSTLHTNNSAGTFPRLIDIGISAEILGSAVTTAMAQRLVRRLCDHCKKEMPMNATQLALVNTWLTDIPHPEELPTNRTSHWVATGCDQCHTTGYKGRLTIVEIILMDATLEQLVRQKPTEREIAVATRYQNIRCMQEDAVSKILKGTTSFDEVARAIDIHDTSIKAAVTKIT
jgi:type IV pilus assembly protein PilB